MISRVFYIVCKGEGSFVWDGPKPHERKREVREMTTFKKNYFSKTRRS